MGLRDKLIAKLTPPPLDYASELRGHLAEDDTFLTSALTIPSAFERGGGSSGDFANRMLSKAIDVASTTVSSARHTGGEEGSIARGLTQKGDMTVMVLGEKTLSWWDFGYDGRTGPAELVQAVPREHVASIVDTGKKAQGGAPVARMTFADGSFFDYRLMSKPGEDFWAVANSYGA